jgi:hypothetical protein
MRFAPKQNMIVHATNSFLKEAPIKRSKIEEPLNDAPQYE